MSSCVESAGGPGGGAVVAQSTTQAEQLCYIPCNYCNIVLAVSVPCNNMMDIVMVRCGHCGNLWSVNMAAAALHSLSSTWLHHRHFQQPQDHLQAATNYNNNVVGDERMENMMGHSSKYNFHNKPRTLTTSLSPPPTISIEERVVNRPPEKRQRVPSAYNQFIKEEIQRIKANNPEISHREAFSTAAKNWAHFPHIHFGLMLETNKQAKLS